MKDPLLKLGIAGAALTALCCFTPVLVIGLGVIGLAGVIHYLDAVLLPLLAAFLAITGYALWRAKRTTSS